MWFISRQSHIFLLLTKSLFWQINANMATFHHSETACPHFSKSNFQSDNFFMYVFRSLKYKTFLNEKLSNE